MQFPQYTCGEIRLLADRCAPAANSSLRFRDGLLRWGYGIAKRGGKGLAAGSRPAAARMDDLAGMEARMKPARRRWLLVVLAVAFCLRWPPMADAHDAAADRKVKELLAAAKVNLDNDEPAAAEKQYSTVLRSQPRNVDALVGRGTALRRLDKFDAALTDFQAALRLNPHNADALSGRGAVYGYKGDFPRTFADCDEAIRLDPKNSDVYSYRGYVRTDRHNFDKAIADFNGAIERNARNVGAWFGRGTAHADNQQIDDAILDFSEGIRLKPKMATRFPARAAVWAAKQEHGKAIADISEAIALKANEAKYYSARASYRCNIKDYDGALADANAATRLESTNRDFYRLRGSIYEAKNDLVRSSRDYDQCRQLGLAAILANSNSRPTASNQRRPPRRWKSESRSKSGPWNTATMSRKAL